MNTQKPQSMASSTLTDRSGRKVRKPYTITKSRESWTDEEHDKFLEALQMFDRDWKKIEDYIGSKTVIQIRSHAQKYFLKVQKNGTTAHVPPPRPKRKATHPYPQKATKNALTPFQASMDYPSILSVLGSEDAHWAHASTFMNTAADGDISPQDEYMNLDADEVDIGLDGIATIGNSGFSGSGSSSGTIPTSDLLKQGTPDFAEVYNFIGSVFDPDTEGHLQKLQDMDPINFETVLSLMRNLTINLSSPEFEPIEKVLSAYAFHGKAAGNTKE